MYRETTVTVVTGKGNYI